MCIYVKFSFIALEMTVYIYIYMHTRPIINSMSDVFHTGMLYVDIAHTEVQLKVKQGGCASLTAVK